MSGTSSRLATSLDASAIGARTTIHPWDTPLADIDLVPDLAAELGGRWLLRYLVARDVRRFEHGTDERQFVTPTPYSPEETVRWLALPAPAEPRRYVLLLDPARLNDVFGPRWVRLGGGIEYILDRGFQREAIVNISPDPGVDARWPLEVS